MLTIKESPGYSHKEIKEQQNPIVQKNSEIRKVKLHVLRQLKNVAIKKTGNLLNAFKLVYQIRKKYRTVFGEPLLSKIAKVDNRYFWRLAAPGFPSVASYRMHENEIGRFVPNHPKTGLRSLLFAITKKCPMNCEHCFEWHNLNNKEDLPVSQVIDIIHKYQDCGTTQIMLSGGEPILRINDIYKILAAVSPGTDFWIITSGLGFNRVHAARLKAAGLTGIMVSLDHFDQKQHDAFRGFQGAYDCAIRAVTCANEVGLVTTLALCATRSFTTEANITAYMNLAKKLGVSFVQFIEPKATGRYFGKDVLLTKPQTDLLEHTYLNYNSAKPFKEYPIINYLGYHQRKVGCFGGGDRFFYIDTDGDAHLCPFCENKVASVSNIPAEDMINLLGQQACHEYVGSQI